MPGLQQERRKLVNLTNGMHPIHVHLIQFLVENRQDFVCPENVVISGFVRRAVTYTAVLDSGLDTCFISAMPYESIRLLQKIVYSDIIVMLK